MKEFDNECDGVRKLEVEEEERKAGESMSKKQLPDSAQVRTTNAVVRAWRTPVPTNTSDFSEAGKVGGALAPCLQAPANLFDS
jgi:hypothetical protein